MILTSNGTYLSYHANKNQIVIRLPQTLATVQTTVAPVVNRRVFVPEGNLMILLQITELLFGIGEESNGKVH